MEEKKEEKENNHRLVSLQLVVPPEFWTFSYDVIICLYKSTEIENWRRCVTLAFRCRCQIWFWKRGILTVFISSLNGFLYHQWCLVGLQILVSFHLNCKFHIGIRNIFQRWRRTEKFQPVSEFHRPNTAWKRLSDLGINDCRVQLCDYFAIQASPCFHWFRYIREGYSYACCSPYTNKHSSSLHSKLAYIHQDNLKLGSVVLFMDWGKCWEVKFNSDVSCY